MPKSLFVLLAVLIGLAQAAKVHDLDDEDHLADISSTGLTIKQGGEKELYLKATSNNGSTGYTWIIDHKGCKDVVTIESGYVFYPPENDDGFDTGYGEEIFTLSVEGYGECMFRIAYARAWEFSSFEDYEAQNGYVIAIPIRVVKDADFSGDYEYTEEDTSKEATAFKIMGSQAWLRSFNGPFHLIDFLPQAIIYSMVTSEKEGAAAKFVWVTKWWAHISGWVTSLGTIAGVLWVCFGVFDTKKGKLLMSHVPEVGFWNNWGWGNWGSSSSSGSIFDGNLPEIMLQAYGVTVLTIEVVGWILFYYSEGNALIYAEGITASELEGGATNSF